LAYFKIGLFWYVLARPNTSWWDFNCRKIHRQSSSGGWTQMWFAFICSCNFIWPSCCVHVWGRISTVCNCEIWLKWQTPVESMYASV